MAQADPTSTTCEARRHFTPNDHDPDFKLIELATAMGAVADLIEDTAPEMRPDGETVAALFRTFAYAIDGIGRHPVITH